MSALLSRGVGLALMLLGILAYVAVGVIEWRLGSVFHAELALSLAAVFLLIGRGERVTVGVALMLGAVMAYGIFRAATDLTLL